MRDYLQKIKELYGDNLNKFALDSRAVGWKDTDSQQLRFHKLNSVITNSNDYLSINDYGCGYGAHLSNLISNGFSISEYNGYDINEKMLEAVEKLKENNSTTKINPIRSSVLTTVADYTLVSGTFNVMPDQKLDKWENFIRTTLLEMAKHSTKGFAFNLLTSYVDWKSDGLYYGNPTYWFDFCKSNISKKVSLLHDYDLFEWTILVQLDGSSR